MPFQTATSSLGDFDSSVRRRLIDHFAAKARPAPSFTGAAMTYLLAQPWTSVKQVRRFVEHAGGLGVTTALDEVTCALLLHGERRRDDRWLVTSRQPVAMPNRRRPLPIVAAEAVADVAALLEGVDLALVMRRRRPQSGVRTAGILGLRHVHRCPSGNAAAASHAEP